MNPWTGIGQLGRDLRHAGRMIARAPVLAAVVILSLGVGIGVNTTIFSWVQAVVLEPLPGVRDASKFELLDTRADSGSHPGSSWLEYLDLEARLDSYPELVASRMVAFNVGGTGRAERTYGQLVSANFFSALGLRPALGRFPGVAEARAGDPVAVISHDYWQTRLGSSPDAIGSILRVNDREL